MAPTSPDKAVPTSAPPAAASIFALANATPFEPGSVAPNANADTATRHAIAVKMPKLSDAAGKEMNSAHDFQYYGDFINSTWPEALLGKRMEGGGNPLSRSTSAAPPAVSRMTINSIGLSINGVRSKVAPTGFLRASLFHDSSVDEYLA